MTDSKKNWDDIPSLDNLQMDWDYEADNPLGKRTHVRMPIQDIAGMLKENSVAVKVATQDFSAIGRLEDISQGGIGLNMKTELSQEQAVKVGFFLGGRKIIANARVKHIKPVAGGYRTGFQFVNLNQDDSEYIGSIYVSKTLKQI